MPYITDEEIRQRIGPTAYVQLTDDDATGSANLAIIAAVRTAAEAEVNSYLARRYRTPIDTQPHPDVAALLRSVTLDVTEHHLQARRPPVPDDIIRRYRHALNWLADVAAGAVALPTHIALPPNPARGTAAFVTGQPAVLARDERLAQ